VDDKAMRLVEGDEGAAREHLGNTSATRSVDENAAANTLVMDSGTRAFDRRLRDQVRDGYLEPDPNSAARTT
jgi:hypothetical protein